MATTSGSEVPQEDIFKILVATDNHLGYNEKDPIRGEDSFVAFEEILELAVTNDVDFILLGGDLFHDATPSQYALHKCITLLRRYTLGDKPIEIEFLSDQSLNFAESLNKSVNYEDPNINISIPVFSIHGNHDDPSGFGRLSSLDLLSVSALVNYFGKCVNLTEIEINPILMRKGETQLALYGLSHIHDNRLIRLFQHSNILMNKPDESTGEWFNLMVLHQNRANRGPKNYVPEEILPDFLDLIVWGHEHDCRILPEENFKKRFYVTQPGSSVATSLSEGESVEKHCGLLKVYKNRFDLTELPLKTVRPFVFDSLVIDEKLIEEHGLDEIDASEKVMEMAKTKIEEMILAAKKKLTGDSRQPQLPLIRLRISYTDVSQMFNGIRFGQQFNGRVANPMEIVLFKRMIKVRKQETKDIDKTIMDGVLKQEDVDHETRVEEVVDRYFEEVDENKKLQLMSSKILSEMCYRLVERNDQNAADNILKFYKEKVNNFLLDNMPGEDDLEECISKFNNRPDILYQEALKMLDERGVKKSSSLLFENKSEDEDDIAKQKPKKFPNKEASNSTQGASRGRGRGRGSGRGRGGRGATSVKSDSSKSVSDSFLKACNQSRNKKNTIYISSDSE